MNEEKDSSEAVNANPVAEADDDALSPELEGVVCTACVEVNPPRTDYCVKCGAPLNALVAFSPFDQTLVEGFAYRRAVEGPPSKIILAGMWLLFFPPVISAIIGLLSRPGETPGMPGSSRSAAEYAFLLAYGGISAWLIYRVTANFLAKRRHQESEVVE